MAQPFQIRRQRSDCFSVEFFPQDSPSTKKTLLKLSKPECEEVLDFLQRNFGEFEMIEYSKLSSTLKAMKEVLIGLDGQHQVFGIRPGTTCTIKGCNKYCDGTVKYCSSIHNKCCILQRNMNEYYGNDEFGYCLAADALESVVNYYNNKSTKDNNLQPKGTIPFDVPRCESLVDVYHTFYKYIKVFFAIMEANVGGTSPMVDNIKARAKRLAIMLHPLHRTVVMMDGHGRFLLQFLHEVYIMYGEERLRTLKIRLLDIDQDVTNWHLSFFLCERIESITMDVFNYLKVLDRTQLYYLNFCGVGNEDAFNTLKRFAREATCPFMVSFSTARKAAGRDTEFSEYLNNHNKKMALYPQLLEDKSRADFKTFVFTYSAKNNMQIFDAGMLHGALEQLSTVERTR